MSQRLVLNYLFNFFFFNDTATTEIYTLSLHDALPISSSRSSSRLFSLTSRPAGESSMRRVVQSRSRACIANWPVGGRAPARLSVRNPVNRVSVRVRYWAAASRYTNADVRSGVGAVAVVAP